ncbi:rhythmically expressed gene 2 protein [Parasteatoda tepidariorum]|uniref:rhythmically expressed gene 2 protein n=1 Tax=Parasteatoda tepidariorum TaxID=114398 RepID=UPI00077FA6FD|nr:rhythmically expressed gene 2 protein isoform X2 [Parasteatoda tepidariorum]XP_042900782.1 rhythmically expressed gene 2 protein isoform X2 [Parasteatoda tepidariorum]
MRSHFKLCTFDITNTLLKFQLPVGEQYAKIGRIYGVERDPKLLTAAFLHNWKVMNSDHPNYGRSTGLTSQFWWKEMVRRVFYAENCQITHEQLDSISGHLYEIYKTETCWKVLPGAAKLLENLNKSDAILGVISNFDERLECVLSSTGLKSYFSFILASYVVQTAKPEKKIFDMALDQIPGVESSDAIHVGDNVKLDYLAAKAAGWNALLITNSEVTCDHGNLVDQKDIAHDVDEIEKYILNQ